MSTPHTPHTPHTPPHSTAAAAVPAGTSVRVNPSTHHERLGGTPAVERLVAAFYRAMDTRPDARVIRAMHEADLAPTRQVLATYLGEWLGGPRLYTPSRGAPMLRRRHQPFDIDTAARDAWMACMRQALAEVCTDEALRAELDAAFSKVADFMRNSESGRAQVPANLRTPDERQAPSLRGLAETGGAQLAHPARPREQQPDQPAPARTPSFNRSVP